MSNLKVHDLESLHSKSLAICVVAYRTLGMNKDLAKDCMLELSKRRTNGDDFEYESFIEEEIKKIPLSGDSKAISAGTNILLGMVKK